MNIFFINLFKVKRDLKTDFKRGFKIKSENLIVILLIFFFFRLKMDNS